MSSPSAALGEIFPGPIAGRVYSPRFRYHWAATHLMPTPRVLAVLDEGARVFGRVDSPRMVERVRAVVHFVRTLLAYDVRLSGAPSFDEVLRRRRGGCLHFTFLTNAILSEAGFAPRMVMRVPSGAPGHIWLEVDVAEEGRTYLVDPTSGLIEPWSTVFATFDAFAREWYFHPDRHYVDPQ